MSRKFFRRPDLADAKDLKYEILFVLLIAVCCISLPTKWLADIMGGGDAHKLIALASVRILFSAAGIALIIHYRLHKVLIPCIQNLKGIDIFVAGLIVAVNNFPIIALVTGEAEITGGKGLIASFLLYCFSVGLFEEVFFRGLIFVLLLYIFPKTKKGSFLAILSSSLLFGAVHLLNLFGGAGIGSVMMQIGYSSLIGGLCSAVLLFTRSLYYAVLLHFVYDIGGLMLGNIGSGNQWDRVTVILTVVVSVAVAAYIVIRFIFSKSLYSVAVQSAEESKKKDG